MKLDTRQRTYAWKDPTPTFAAGATQDGLTLLRAICAGTLPVPPIMNTLAIEPAAGRAAELAGPREERVPDMARRLASARGRRPLVISLPLPGATGRGMRTGALLPTSPGPRGTQTFDQWLQDQTVRSSLTTEGNQ